MIENYGFTYKKFLGHGEFGYVYLVSKNNINYVLKIEAPNPHFKPNIVNETNILVKILPDCDKYFICIEPGIQTENKYIILFPNNRLGFLTKYKGADLIPIKEYKYKGLTRETKTIAINLLNALEKLSEYNIIHGDLNDENVLIDKKTLETFIIDFGESCDLDNRVSPQCDLYENSNNLSDNIPFQYIAEILASKQRRYNIFEKLFRNNIKSSSNPYEKLRNFIKKLPIGINIDEYY